MTVCWRRSRCHPAMRWRWVRRGRLIRRATGTPILSVQERRGFGRTGPSRDEEVGDERRREGQREEVVGLAISGIAEEEQRRQQDAGEVRKHDGFASRLA